MIEYKVTDILKTADMNVAKTAYKTAKSMGASAMVMRSMFEVLIVESGVKNLDHGDGDSVGAYQQTHYWGTVAQRMDVAHATHSYVAEAMRLEPKYDHSYTLAAAVQKPALAYVDRYRLAYYAALALYAKTKIAVLAA